MSPASPSQRRVGCDKMNSTLLFSVKEQGIETRKLSRLLEKEEEVVEVQRDVQKLIGKVVKIVVEMQVKVLLI